ncbi:hypothetical protein H8A95_04690 [Bradyrhizobium sp. Pear76]|uniref:hypothetical protein n=1 Tax=Bradyrhizobium oropedii TaxID=1571201 RepID=UPI001E40803B|nr:hypothetical protein [Bradyrhizobium oropedii]MCC8961635.1 hypothetical protein [Bradyrhizobium oropedii]
MIFGIFVATKTPMMATSYSNICTTNPKDSLAAAEGEPPFESAQVLRELHGQAEADFGYWLQTVLEDRAESAPPPAPASKEAAR